MLRYARWTYRGKDHRELEEHGVVDQLEEAEGKGVAGNVRNGERLHNGERVVRRGGLLLVGLTRCDV